MEASRLDQATELPGHSQMGERLREARQSQGRGGAATGVGAARRSTWPADRGGDAMNTSSPGMALSLDASAPHRLWAIDDEDAEAIWVVVGRQSDGRGRLI